MTSRTRERIIVAALLLPAVGVFCAGITWGLPTSDAGRFLFGSRLPWDGATILELAGDRGHDRQRGADVDPNPLARTGDGIIRLNETDAQRAEIIRRYRLYTHQPDEMITMMSLASMRPSAGDFDPKLYQYGGLWIYPVGALLKLGSLLGAVTLRADPAYYLDHPEDFGRFYIIARLYVVAWALVGVCAVFRIARRLMPNAWAAPAVAAVCFFCLPAVVNLAHEAKPHLPAAVLMLLAIGAAIRYATQGQPNAAAIAPESNTAERCDGGLRACLIAGALCGTAYGMVLSALPVFAILPVMVLLRPIAWRTRSLHLLASIAAGVGTYLVTNPYILINLLTNRAVLESNFGNSLAMYAVGRWREGLLTAGQLIAAGATLPIAVGGAVAAVAFVLTRARRSDASCTSQRAAGLLLLTPALLIVLQFVALAAGKPGEYGRFAIFPDIALTIAAVALVHHVLSTHRKLYTLLLIVLVWDAAREGFLYERGFWRDARDGGTRLRLARELDDLHLHGARTLGVFAEPAPYVMPPVDLFGWKLLLLPRDADAATFAAADVILWPEDSFAEPHSIDAAGDHFISRRVAPDPGELPDPVRRLLPRSMDTPISWADKPFLLLVQRSPERWGSESFDANQLRGRKAADLTRQPASADP